MREVALWLKVPLILLQSASLHVAMTPPTPHTKVTVEERARYTRGKSIHDYFPLPYTWGPQSWKTVGMFINLLDILAILASLLPGIIGAPLAQACESLSRVEHHARLYVSPVFLVGCALALFGAGVRLSCYRHLGTQFTFELTVQDDHKLVTTGPYAVVRHPSYTGVAIFYVGAILAQFGPGSYWHEAGLWGAVLGKLIGVFYVGTMVYVTAVVFSRVGREDDTMRKTFGEKWGSWAKKTPYRLFPLLY